MNKRILVIEDNPSILLLLTDLLTRFGYGVACASSGADALEKLGRGEFDAILLDICLPDMDGKAVYRMVKERSENLARRIILLTGDLGNPDTASFVAETGILFLEKPFTLLKLREVIERFFNERSP